MNSDDDDNDIARIIDQAAPFSAAAESDDAAAPPETPDPVGEGVPWHGEDGVGEDFVPIELPRDWREIDPDVLTQCAREPQNDTGNGQRLIKHFGERLLNVRETSDGKLAGWHVWTGAHWKREGGGEAAIGYAQRVAARIALEADYLAATPHEARAIEAAVDATVALDKIKAKNKKKSDAEKKEMARLERVIEIGAEAQAELAKRQNKRRQFAVSSGNGSRLREMLNQAVPHRTVGQDQLDADPLAFNVANGTLRFECYDALDLESDPAAPRYTQFHYARLDPHAPADLCARVSPVEYDPAATCPNFLASFERFQPSEPVRRYLQKYYGYAMTGLNGEQCLVFNGGGGSNWKSTFIEIIARVMGDYCQTLKFESIAGDGTTTGTQASPDIARLPGARLVRASEPDQRAPLKEGLIKSLTGGEPMLARHNYGNFFQFYPVFKLSLSGNHKPDISGVDHGIWRRIRYVIWPVTIADAERREFNDVMAELWAERAGILNWLVEGARLYLSEGLKVPQEITDATSDYREEQDPVGGFIGACVTVTPPSTDPAAIKAAPFVSAQDIFEAFECWASHNGVRAWKQKAFGAALSQKGFVKDRTASMRRYLWVSLHDVPARRHRTEQPPHPADDEVPL